jgi:hypothetical protein
MVPCTLKTGEEKSTYAGLAHEIGFFFSPAYLLSLLVKRTANSVHLLEKRVINIISDCCPAPRVFDWPILMIVPGGLLLVVPHYFRSLLLHISLAS